MRAWALAFLLTSCAPALPPAPASQAVTEALRRGRGFLLAHQNADGSWGSARHTKGLNIYAPVPGAHHAFRAAVTALAVSALIETTDDRDGEALARAEAWMARELPRLKRATPDALYNVWGHAYAIQALVRLRGLPGDAARRKRLSALIREQVRLLAAYESVNGGWGYYDFEIGSQRPASTSTSFVTATVLVALREAREAGFEVPEPVLSRAAASIHRQRKPDFSYLYAEDWRWRPLYGINRPAGSLARSQACNTALRQGGDPLVTDAVTRAWLDRLFARQGWLDMGRKRPVPHESWFQVAGYFFYYGHSYAARGIAQLPAGERRAYQDRLAAVLLPLQEKDGSWWDYPLYDYGQAYGTAFALLSLARCR